MRMIIICIKLIKGSIDMQVVSIKEMGSALLDPELPTANDVFVAISAVATQYALNPSHELAEIALDLASNLNAPEYAGTSAVAEVARKLKLQWSQVVEEYQLIEASIMPQHELLQ